MTATQLPFQLLCVFLDSKSDETACLLKFFQSIFTPSFLINL
jgi:hypothetical protein